MKTIVFVIPKLGGGGAERVISTLVRHIDKKKFKVHLIIVHDGGDYQTDLPVDVNLIKLPVSQVRYAIPSLYLEIRRIKPDIVFSSIRGFSALIALFKTFLPRKTKLVIRENNTPSESISESKYPLVWKIVYNTIFKKVDKIICQSDYMVEDFKNEFGFDESKLIRIYNPVDIEMVRQMSMQDPSPFGKEGYKNVVVVGKMMPQKGIDILLNSVAKNKNKLKNVKIWILGNGKYFRDYVKLSENLGITNYVNFVGRQANPFIWMKNADLFLLPSRYEGLPNVVLEAIACGCPVVSTSHPGGTKEIMELTGNIQGVVEELTWDNSWFNQNKIKVTELENVFGVKSILMQYEDLLYNLKNV
ncbi:glycosyltransferase [Sporosarcina thermotolerans]|uniref:Glycosyltransferase n=1 Tax=Sporosarcina thermotolerans TaxID=633404 RepID=A0AAW9A6P1_9BACL|nr:glycosyltransferase [Sporosarcina thermotolerans]MDW0116303.1 glycosyltransferase [Sporosarcina thermotolerans]